MVVFDPNSFFSLSQSLLTNSTVDINDEAVQRTVISRSYYACYLVARDSLFGLDKRTLSKAIKKKIMGGRHGGDHLVISIAIAKGPSKNNLRSGECSEAGA